MILHTSPFSKLIFDFKNNSNIKNWVVVDDAVMGGVSSGNFSLDKNGYGVFKGNISLENNGGFSSVKYDFEKMEIGNCSQIYLKIKGDGKKYQFRIKGNSNDDESYSTTFNTTEKWQEILIDLKDLYPTFRGRKLDKPNFFNTSLEEIRFLIANQKKETFKLLIDKIELR